MPSTLLLSLGAVAAVISIAVYLPMQRTESLYKGPDVALNFGLEQCQRVAGPSHCDDVRIQRNLNLAFLACDPSLPYRNFAASVHDESEMKENGGIWIYDLNKPGSEAEKLAIKGFDGPFHPSGLTFGPIPADGTPARVVVLAVNHVPFEVPRVEMFYYSPAKRVLTHKKTISSEYFSSANKISGSDTYIHQLDDTPSFFLSNDHGYNLTNWKREYEEKYNLPASTLVYYNARSDRANEVGWRFQMLTGIVASSEKDGLWLAQGKSGTIEEYKAHLLSEEHQEEEIFSVDTNERMKVIWPGMLNEQIMNTKVMNIGVDYDPNTNALVSVAHQYWHKHLAYAKEQGSKDIAPEDRKEKSGGFVAYKAVQYPVRIGETRPKPLKGFEFNETESPRRYKMKSFFEPAVASDGTDFGAPSAIAVTGDRVLITGQYEQGFLDCRV